MARYCAQRKHATIISAIMTSTLFITISLVVFTLALYTFVCFKTVYYLPELLSTVTVMIRFLAHLDET